jgi:excisionase family DNA binding protein
MMEAKQQAQLEPVWARIDEVAQSRGLTRAKIYQLIKSGALVPAKLGRATLIKCAELDAHIEGQRVAVLPGREEMKRRRNLGIDRQEAARRRSPTPLGA